MPHHLANIAPVVNDYNEAIEFYTKKTNFIVVEGSVLSETKRWVLAAPRGNSSCCLQLATLAAQSIRTGMGLLGITVPEIMQGDCSSVLCG